MLLFKELIMAEDIPHITVQCITTFNPAFVFCLVSVCCDTAQAGLFTVSFIYLDFPPRAARVP